VILLNNFRIKRENILPFEAASLSYRVKMAAANIKEKYFYWGRSRKYFPNITECSITFSSAVILMA